MPVLLVDGVAYGPADHTPGQEPLPWLTEPAYVSVAAWLIAHKGQLTAEQEEIADRFWMAIRA